MPDDRRAPETKSVKDFQLAGGCDLFLTTLVQPRRVRDVVGLHEVDPLLFREECFNDCVDEYGNRRCKELTLR